MNNRSAIIRLIAVVLVVLPGLSITSQASDVAAAASNSQMEAIVQEQVSSLVSDGTWAVWPRPVAENQTSHDVVALNLRTNEMTDVATGSTDQGGFGLAVDQGVVVWTESAEPWTSRDIRGKDLNTGRTFDVATTSDEERSPKISGRWVVWMSEIPATGGQGGIQDTLWARDIDAMTPAVKLVQGVQAQGNSGRDIRPLPFSFYAVSGDHAAWVERADPDQYPSRLVVEDLASGTTQTIAEDAYDVDIGGETLVYSDKSASIHAVDLARGTATAVPVGNNGLSFQPITDGRFVIWGSYASPGSLPLRYWIYDLQSSQAYILPIATQPLLAHGTVVWSDLAGSDQSTLHGVAAADLFNGVLLQYFTETDHSVALGFLTHWRKSGGLSILGYPIGDEIGGTQNFERQRFEYHPENAGTPYEVLLGRVGVEDASHRGLDNSPPFQGLPSDTTSDENCTFYQQSAHRLCFGFRSYWSSHGLELGDPGISERESIALFGYPISEEFTDPDTGLTVQYFERARFEYHPGNPEPYKVLLGRLVADAAQGDN